MRVNKDLPAKAVHFLLGVTQWSKMKVEHLFGLVCTCRGRVDEFGVEGWGYQTLREPFVCVRVCVFGGVNPLGNLLT